LRTGFEPLHSRAFLGIDLIVAGVGWISVGFGLKART
jgi:hypothetical protein